MKEDTASKVAEFLLQIKAVKIRPAEPFTWASGLRSPIYCDNRVTLSHPRVRTYLRQEMVKCLESKFGRPDLVAGVATGAIAIGALIAEAMGLPFIYVRTSSKDHGLKNKIEGDFQPNMSAVVIEDLVSTGGSSLKAVQALKESNILVKGMISIFTYGFQKAADAFRDAGCPLYSLSNYDVLVTQAAASGYIREKDIAVLQSWKQNPENWKPVEESVSS